MRTRGLLLFLFLSLAAMVLPVQAAPDDAGGLWSTLHRPPFDPEKVAVAEAVTLERDSAQIEFRSGTIGFARALHGCPFAAAFRGTGRLRVSPVRLLEQQQLAFHTGAPALEVEFSDAILQFSDSTLDEVASQVRFRPGDAAPLESLYADRVGVLVARGTNWEPRLIKALLSADPARNRFFRGEFKTDKFGWVTVVLDSSRAEEFQLSRHDAATSFYLTDIWVSQPAGKRPIDDAYRSLEARQDFLIDRYRLDVAVEGQGELTATAAVELKVQHGGERVLLLQLDPHLQVTGAKDDSGRAWAVFQPRDPKEDPFLGDFLVVVAPEPISPGALTLEFQYGGKRVVRNEGSGVFFAQNWNWYPGYYDSEVTFATRSHFDLTLRVAKKFQVVTTGKKVEEKVEGDWIVVRSQSEIPLAVAGFAFGEYNVKTQQVGNVRVEVYANKRPDDLLRTIEIIAEDPMPEQNRRINPIAGIGLMTPARLANEMVNEMVNSLRVFEKYFGPYPYEKLAMSNIASFRPWGQGWPSLIYLSSLSFLDANQRSQLGLGGYEGQLTDRWRAHEVSHQWWGHAVSWRSYHDQWLSEGFAEYSGMMYTFLRRNPKEFIDSLRLARRDLLYKDQFGAVHEQVGPIYAGRRLLSARHVNTYQAVVYGKGAWVLHMLRMMLFDSQNKQDPDARFSAMMQEFVRTHLNRAASTADFQRIVEKHMSPQMDMDGNGRMDWFFNQWVYGTGVPEYSLHYQIVPGSQPGAFILRGRVLQKNVPEGFKMPVPLYITKGKTTFLAGWLPVLGAETPIEIPLEFRPDKASLNEQEDILCIVSGN